MKWLGGLLIVLAYACAETSGSNTGMDGGGSSDGGSLDAMPDPLPDASVPDASDYDARVPDASDYDASDPDAADPDPDAEICPGLAVPGSIGSPAEPYAVSADDPELITDMLLDSGRAFVRIDGLEPGQRYTLTASAGGGGAELAAFDDDEAFDQAGCIEQSAPPHGGAVCNVVASSSSLYLSIASLVGPTPISLTIHRAHPAQGTEEAPVALDYGAMPAFPVVATQSPASYYEILGLTNGQAYSVSVEGLSAFISLVVAAESLGLGSDSATSRTPSAIGIPTGNSLIVRLTGEGLDATGELKVTPVELEGQGSAEQPMQLDYLDSWPTHHTINAAWNDTFAPPVERARHYFVLNNVPSGWHVLRVATAAKLNVLSFGEGSTFVGALDCLAQGRGTLECATRTQTGSIYFVVENIGGPGGAFELTVDVAPHVSEGKKSKPIAVPLSTGGAQGHVAPHGTSYYVLTGLRAGERYRIDNTRISGSTTTRVLSDSAFTEPVCMFGENSANGCVAEALGTKLYLYVVSEDGLGPSYIGASFRLGVEPIEDYAATDPMTEVVLPCAEGGTYQGQAGVDGLAFVELRGLDNQYEYVVEISGRDRFEMNLFSGEHGPFKGDSCNVWGNGQAPVRCVQRPVDSVLYLQVESTPAGMAFEGSVRAVEIDPLGTLLDPVELDRDAAELYEGRVPGAQGAYLALIGLEPNTSYTLRIASFEEQVNGEVSFGLAGFTGVSDLYAVPGTPVMHELTTGSTTTAVYLHLFSSDPSPSSFTLQLATN